jgi:hypothetical protein
VGNGIFFIPLQKTSAMKQQINSDTERFLLLSEPFDYTEWRRDNLFPDMSLDEIIDAADKYCKENN